jgi:cadmium resistance protein CadD (predicted permease)
MSAIRLMSLATGCMCILMFIIMVTFLIVVIGKSVNELYLICMLGCVPIGIGCIMAAYMEGEY